MLLVGLFFLTLWLAGALYSWQLLRPAALPVRLGSPIVIGEVLYLSIYVLLPAVGPWRVALYALAFAGCTALGFLLLSQGRRGFEAVEEQPYQRGYGDVVCGLVVFGLYFCRTLIFGGYDELNHFFFASQIASGKFPPSVYAFADVPAKYHYGWDILLASTSQVGRAPLPRASDLLTLFSVVGSIALLTGLLRMLEVSPTGRCLGILGFFLGGGLLEPIGFLRPEIGSVTLSLMSTYHQHAWTFTVNMFLLLLALFAIVARPSPRQLLLLLIWLFPLLGAASVYAVTLIPVIGLVLAVLLVYWMLSKRTLSVGVIGVVGILACGMALMACWVRQHGMLAAAPEVYDSPRFRLAGAVFGWQNYLKYEGAYLLMTPVGVWGSLSSLRYAVRMRRSFGDIPVSRMFLVASCICLLPLPLLFLAENAAYWDNFCKFNVVGILAAWILASIGVSQRWASWLDTARTARRHFVIGSLLLVCLVGPSFCFLFMCAQRVVSQRDQNPFTSRHKAWEATQGSKATLTTYFRTCVPLGEQILLLNKAVDRMYPISRLTNKPDVNLYEHIDHYFGDFTVLAQSCGASIVNFYDYNFLYNRSREYRLYDALDRLYAGDSQALQDLGCSYLLVMKENQPDFLPRWQEQHSIEEAHRDNAEGWILYRIPSPVRHQAAAGIPK